MNKELKIQQSNQAPLIPNIQTQVQQTGERNTFINTVATLNQNIYLPNDVLPEVYQNARHHKLSTLPLNREYYSLFVTNLVNLSDNNTHFFIEPNRALTENMEAVIKEKFSTLNKIQQEEIKKIPCIFANENEHYGKAGTEQIAILGYIKDIMIRSERIRITPEFCCSIKQSVLNKYLFELGIDGSVATNDRDGFNEFNRTHWAIKEIDLISELQKLGFEI